MQIIGHEGYVMGFLFLVSPTGHSIYAATYVPKEAQIHSAPKAQDQPYLIWVEGFHDFRDKQKPRISRQNRAKQDTGLSFQRNRSSHGWGFKTKGFRVQDNA